MKRRDFLKGCLAAVAAPLAMCKGQAKSPSDHEIIVGLNDCDKIVKEERGPAKLSHIHSIPKDKCVEFYAWAEQGFAVLDNRRILLAEF